MSYEDLKLVTIDLCSRFAYTDENEVIWNNQIFNVTAIGFGRVTLVKRFMSRTEGSPQISEVKPLLTPITDLDPRDFEGQFEWEVQPNGKVVGETAAFDYFNSHGIDYRGLIEKELAENKNTWHE